MLLAKQTAPRTAIGVDVVEIEHALCNGLGRVNLPVADGTVRLFICGGCSACHKAPTSDNRHLDAVEVDNAAREARLADVFAATGDDDEF